MRVKKPPRLEGVATRDVTIDVHCVRGNKGPEAEFAISALPDESLGVVVVKMMRLTIAYIEFRVRRVSISDENNWFGVNK